MLIGSRRPLHAHMALPTGRLLVLPINVERRQIIAVSGFGLPLILLADQTNHLNPVLLAALQDDPCIHIAPIQQMLAWAKISGMECLMDRFSLAHICRGGIRCHHVRDEVGKVFITGFAEMDVVAKPSQIAFMPMMGLMIIGRTQGQMGRG